MTQSVREHRSSKTTGASGARRKSVRSQRNNILATAKAFRANVSLTDKANLLFLNSFPESCIAKAMLTMYENQDFAGIIETDIDPRQYTVEETYKFRDDFQVVSYFSKNRYFDLPFDKDARAYAKFWEFEGLCKATNLRFSNLGRDPSFNGSRVWLLNATIRKISEILRSFEVDSWVDSCGWGPGVTRTIKGKSTSAAIKYSFENGITRDLYHSMFPVMQEAWPSWLAHKTVSDDRLCGLTLYEGNAVCTVPKNAKINRVIAIEPGLNVFVQKGIGRLIRRRMRSIGINLNDASKNVEMARLGSLYNSYATIDFSSASDSIAREVVRVLLSGADPTWFQLMDLSRSKYGLIEDASGESRQHPWEKFSSMGNGFTWELESLIFYAAAAACCEYVGIEPEISVFGDDVVLPTSACDVFVDFSAFLGFKVNEQKSFSTGHFRESCGAFWFNGVDCKPYFQKEALNNVESVYRMANGIRRLAHRRNSYYGCDERLRTVWLHLLCRVPKSLRFFVPDSLGDVGFVGNFDEARPSLDRSGKLQQYVVTCLGRRAKTTFHDEIGLLFSSLDYLQSTGSSDPNLPASSSSALGNEVTLRDITHLCVQRLSVNGWYNLGDWI